MDEPVQNSTQQYPVQPQSTQAEPAPIPEQSPPPPSETVSEQLPPSPAPLEPTKPSFIKPLIILILLVILIVGGFVGFTILRKERGQVQEQATQVIRPASPTPQLQAGPYVGYQTISLRDPQGGNFTGTATRSIFPENVFISVSAKLADPPEGQFYQAWLSNAGGDFVSLGTLYKDGKGQYSTIERLDAPSFSSFSNVLYNSLIVTSETLDDQVPETRLLEGSFTK